MMASMRTVRPPGALICITGCHFRSFAMSSSSILSSPHFLRNVLRVDALSCIACGALQVAFPAAMARLSICPRR
jgi:hypothetical protein